MLEGVLSERGLLSTPAVTPGHAGRAFSRPLAAQSPRDWRGRFPNVVRTIVHLGPRGDRMVVRAVGEPKLGTYWLCRERLVWHRQQAMGWKKSVEARLVVGPVKATMLAKGVVREETVEDSSRNKKEKDGEKEERKEEKVARQLGSNRWESHSQLIEWRIGQD